MPERWVRSTCPYCGVGCGVEVGVRKGGIVQIRGDRSHPANFGKLCPKPIGLPEALRSPDRLTHPLRPKANGALEQISWEDALGEVARRLAQTVERYGPKGVAFYISGQLLTEDYYAVNKLAKGFLGTNNVDSNSRLCMSSAVAGYVGAFGTDGPPTAYSDIGYAECILLWGSNTAECHPVTFGRIKDRKKDPKVSLVVVDPRRTPTADIANLHLRIKPGTDLALSNAMLRVLLEDSLIDRRFIERNTNGFEEVARVARTQSVGQAARVCGVPAEEIVRAARLFGEASAAMILWTMGVNQGDHQPVPRHGQRRQTWRRTFQPHRTAQCNGRPGDRGAFAPFARLPICGKPGAPEGGRATLGGKTWQHLKRAGAFGDGAV